MTEAFKQGFMSVMRKFAADNTKNDDDTVSPILDGDHEPVPYIAQSAVEQGLGLHQPVTAAQVGKALHAPQYRDSVLKYWTDNGVGSDALDMMTEAAMQNYLDTTKQQPSERMPTPYEFMQYAIARDGKNEDVSPAYTEEGNTAFQAALMNPNNPLSEEVLRRLWAGTTNAVPIASVSPAFRDTSRTRTAVSPR